MQAAPEQDKLGTPWTQASDDWQAALMQQIQDLPDVLDADLNASLGQGLAPDLPAFSGESSFLAESSCLAGSTSALTSNIHTEHNYVRLPTAPQNVFDSKRQATVLRHCQSIACGHLHPRASMSI